MILVHPQILETRTLEWPDEAACAAHAGRLARLAPLRDALIELHGPLGAGKTTWVRHLLRALGVEGRIKSPTYAVLEPYTVNGLDIAHFDFYRFADPREWADAGLRDIFAEPGLKLVEWPEKAAGHLPSPDLRLHIEPADSLTAPAHGPVPGSPAVDADNARHVRVEAFTPRGQELLAA